MSKQLPEYLRMRVNAAPSADSVVIAGNVRFTVITSQLIRMEQGAWTDDATLTVICRDFARPPMKVQQEGKITTICTGALTLRYDAALPLREGLTIQRNEQPCFLWHWGQKPLQNLKGTTSTLDTVNGECPLEDGLCAIDGFAWIDDSRTPRMTADGWFAPREKCDDVYFFGYGHDYTAAVQDYYRLTGAPELLPAFALGNWWSRYHAYTDEEYLSLMDRFQQKDVPLSVGIVDMDWHLTDGDGREYWTDGWTGYTWNEKLFPDYRTFIRGLHDRGLKTALNLHPSSGVRKWEKQYEAMCQALGKDSAAGKPVPFNCLNPGFLKAYFEILHFPYEADGVDFWWMDWQQGSHYPSIVGEDDQETGLESITPLWMLNHMHYLASRRNGGRGLIFSRFAGYGSQRYPIGFSGDTYITWESLKFQPYFTATASNVGYSWWSHDIGGHMGGYRDDELTVRWIQLGVFSPIFRLHSSDSPFLGREPWNYNKRAEIIISDFMRLRHRLFPYLYTMNRRNSAALLPLVRPMYHVYPEYAESYQVRNEYWFGSEMIAAPITEKADASDLAHVSVWLPEGTWTDGMTGYIYHGGRMIDAYRPMEEMPLFLRAGAIIPMQAHEPGSRRLGKAERMEVLVAPGASNTFRLYEDDGETLAYQQGAYAETPLTLEWNDTQATFTISPVEGDAALVPQRSWTVRFRGFCKGCICSINGMDITAQYDAATTTYTVALPPVAPSDGIMVCIRHETALTHDNSDCRTRILDRITRAQNTQEEKHFLLKKADEAIARLHHGEEIRDQWFFANTAPALGGYMREMIEQLPVSCKALHSSDTAPEDA